MYKEPEGVPVMEYIYPIIVAVHDKPVVPSAVVDRNFGR